MCRRHVDGGVLAHRMVMHERELFGGRVGAEISGHLICLVHFFGSCIELWTHLS